MKKIAIINLFICLFSVFNAAGQVNLPQISSSDVENFVSAQPNEDQVSISSITQLGNYNTARLTQTQESDLLSSPNSSNSFQQGDNNLADLTQKGNQNVLFCFQLGYLTSASTTESTDITPSTLLNLNANSTGLFTNGNNNTLISSQEGNSNKFVSIQQGSNNYIQAEQVGNNNNLLVQQVGTNNRVENFVQNNTLGENDTVYQTGENITLNSINTSNTLYGNNYMQNGTNLSITLNNTTTNSLGGITVNQTGHDMSVVIDKSYFSFPLK